MKLSFNTARTSGLAQVSRFMMWHHGHHQLCSDTTTNFFSAAARAKVASLHSLQKPPLLSIGAAWATDRSSNRAVKTPKNRLMEVSLNANGGVAFFGLPPPGS